MKKNSKKNRTAQKRKGAAMKRRWGRGAAYVLTFALAFLTTYLLSSCADHDDMFDSGIKVGNILLSDNTMVAPGSYDAGSMHAVGVVFYAKGDTAIAVAPVELGDHSSTLPPQGPAWNTAPRWPGGTCPRRVSCGCWRGTWRPYLPPWR